jgi:hypothetical protein
MRVALTRAGAIAWLACLALTFAAIPASAQIRAQARPATPAWTKGIQPISSASYYDAIECGKKGGTDPACVFWDTGLCKNTDFELALFTPYKYVAYEVWRNVSQQKPAPQPNYAEAQRTRITVGVTPVRGSTNAFKDLVLKRGGRAVEPTARSVPSRRYTYDFPAFAPTGTLTIEMVGAANTVSCTISRAVLATFR